MGLLDSFNEFVKTPEGMGLLSAVAGGLAGANRGTPINNLGRAGLAGVMGYGNALDRQERMNENAVQNQFRQMQIGELKRKQEQQARIDELIKTLPPEQQQALGLGVGYDKIWDRQNPKVEPYTLTPGAKRFGIDNQVVAEAPVERKAPEGMQYDAAGNLVAIPGYVEMRSRIAAAGRAPAAPPVDKVPMGYRMKPDGSMEAIPGGPADLKAQATSQRQADGATDVDVAISSLRDAYDRLEKGGGITSTQKDPLSNLSASASSSALGQGIGKMFGTQNQSARNDIAMGRPALLAALMKATGMSAKQMDSNAELKLWLTTATDPTLDVESNRRALANIEKKYLKNGSQADSGRTVVKTGRYNGRKVTQYSDGSIEYAD